MLGTPRTLLTLALLAAPSLATAADSLTGLGLEVSIYLKPLCNVFRVDKQAGNEIHSAQRDGTAVSPPPDLLSPGILRVVALPGESVAYSSHLDGFRVWVVNGSDREQTLPTVGWNLRMLREVTDDNGQWRAIDDRPDGSCGRSRHAVHLPAGRAWSFDVPRTNGSFSTSMRFRLETPDGVVYSNSFPAAIDPILFDAKCAP